MWIEMILFTLDFGEMRWSYIEIVSHSSSAVLGGVECVVYNKVPIFQCHVETVVGIICL